jgi:predicted phage terminase large subunit-like protein
MPDDQTAIVDVIRFQYSPARRDGRILEVAKADLAAYRGRVVWWFETESGIQGSERTAAIVRRVQALGLPVYAEHPTGSKLNRAEPLAAAAEAGNVLLCPGEWRDGFRARAADFTGAEGGEDDEIDAADGAFAKLSVPAATVTFSTMSL